MPPTGFSRVGTTPPPRTAETEHLWDRGIPKAQSKAENGRRKYTVYGRPVKPSKETPPEFWGERLPYFQETALRKVNDTLNFRPKKKRKPKNRPQEVALAMDGTDITKVIEAGRPATLELPAEPEERPSVRSGPLPGFMRGKGKKRKRDAAEAANTSVYDMALPYEEREPVQQDVLTAGTADTEEPPNPSAFGTQPSTTRPDARELELVEAGAEEVEQWNDVAVPQDAAEDDAVAEEAFTEGGMTAPFDPEERMDLLVAVSENVTSEPREASA